MPGEKRFRNSFMGGFKKSDVNIYIEKLLKEFDEKLKNKDDEIAVLKNQNKDLRHKYDDLSKKSDEIGESRSKIANVLIQAQENAEKILENARLEALEEKKKLEEMIEKDKEKIVDIRSEIKTLKSGVVALLRKYEDQLTELAREEEEAQEREELMARSEAAAVSEQGWGSGTSIQSTADTDYEPGFTRY